MVVDNFTNIKYNNIKKWENLKSYVSLSKKDEIPKELLFDKYNDNILGINWEAIDFSPNSLEKHFEKHKKEFNGIDIDLYQRNAKILSNRDIDNINILGFTNDNGYVFRYDKEKNEFATIKPSGVIETYFKPKTGYDYWKEQVEKYGNKKDL